MNVATTAPRVTRRSGLLCSVEGESLRDRLKREKQLPVEEALRIAEQVASALDFAHRHDVIHRDIKPEDILLHEGVSMVADFGIALAVKAAGGERLTETGLSIGTPAYMSPEQVSGEQEIDGRSDVYSLACVLYEMLAGQPPFTGGIPEIAEALNVRYALEGSVRKAGNSLRITAQLIDAVSDAHVWAEKYDGVLEDVFGMQEQVSRSIVDAMELNLLPEEEKQLTERRINDPKAYALYMKARDEALRGTAEATQAALRDLELGLEILGDNELLYYGMADALVWGMEYAVMTEDEAMGRVEELAGQFDAPAVVKQVLEQFPHGASPSQKYVSDETRRFFAALSTALG